MPSFSVDTQLFRELGSLLVSRDSTALIELIKNAYDADSTAILVLGSNLEDPDEGEILIRDNGIGMSRQEFESGFLRIATRVKSQGERRSGVYGRKFTGEKGVGRLALHKLAGRARISSYRWNGKPPRNNKIYSDGDGVLGNIDWDAIEQFETLEDVDDSRALSVSSRRKRHQERLSGTTICLDRLRKAWTQRDLDQFQGEIATLVPPESLTGKLPHSVISDEMLLPSIRYQDTRSRRTGSFDVSLEGDFAFYESFGGSNIEQASWIVEVFSDARRKAITYQVTPTQKTINSNATAFSQIFEVGLEDEDPTVSFHARIFQRTGRRWDKRYQGIRIYHEGFRVLPYGDPQDDWLELNLDYARRVRRRLPRLLAQEYEVPGMGEIEEIVTQPNAAYFGGVFLTRRDTPNLHMLINREGFLPSPILDFIAKRVRIGLDLLVRVRYSCTPISAEVKRSPSKQRRLLEESDETELPTAFALRRMVSRINRRLKQAVLLVREKDIRNSEIAIKDSAQSLLAIRQELEYAINETMLLRVLASVGTELFSFTHEINGLVTLAQELESSLERLEENRGLIKSIQSKLSDSVALAREFRQQVERNASYLIDISSVDRRRRRSREKLAVRFDKATEHLSYAVTKNNNVIENRIDNAILSPPMFPVELTSVFTNLLTNAIKFSKSGGRIRASSGERANEVFIRIENEGESVDIENSDELFRPFHSTTTSVDATLGQGMGLGLTITRSILDEYGATINFRTPSKGFDASVEIRFSK